VRLVARRQLSPAQRTQLGAAFHDRGFAAVAFGPPGSALARAVDRRAAQLLEAHREPGRITAAMRRHLGRDAGRVVARLVLDGLLEIDTGGGFASGARAIGLLNGGRGGSATPAGRLPALSRAAIAHAAALTGLNGSQLGRRLYTYHTLPATPAWRARLLNRQALIRHLDLGRLDDPRQDMRDDGGVWLRWRRHGGPRPHEPCYKVYLSAHPDDAARCLRAALALLAPPFAAIGCKVGADVFGLLRPDKLVIYFARWDALQRGVRMLRRDLTGARAHGVPFTAPLAADGLLSWGMDPPASRRLLMFRGLRSWRGWLTTRLGHLLAAAHQAGLDAAEAAAFATVRLSLDGVDTGDWKPLPGVWDDDAAKSPR
jgi:hypothetical protein